MIVPGVSVIPPTAISSQWWVTLQLSPNTGVVGHRPNLDDAIDEALLLAIDHFETGPEQMGLLRGVRE